MIVPLRKWLYRARFLLLFLLLTIVLYQVMSVLSVWIEPFPKYREPEGRAVKVFIHQAVEAGRDTTFIERLKLFLWYGE
ncbi:hypothetical protein J31TS4_08350 [Paenibacillus sp. J31TS4]|uniref:DUF4227 family protein n=1 Tax=Paenibacillus sp. J31TS4 TaxID=2807195 RepID=UPI001B23853E|nr:DUF4227 family protein [Paenibacillus sp. J31TS4]GIP37555.1 hypothetical protein J31TS4_08350 [Paenibacillus sp. J31TS4]